MIPAIEQRTGAHFDYVPILLGGVFKLTNNQPPMVQFKGIKNKGEYQRLEVRRFIKKHGLTRFRMNPHFPVNTVQIMRGAVAAGSGPALQRYVEVVFKAMWEEEKDGRCGGDPRHPRRRRSRRSKPRWRGSRSRASRTRCSRTPESSVARGTFGAPTFYVGDEIFWQATASAPSRSRLAPRALEAEADAAVASHLVVVDHQAGGGRHGLAGQDKAARDFPWLERVVGGHARLSLDHLGAAGAAHAALAGVGHANALGQGGVDHVAAPGHHKGVLNAIKDGDGLRASPGPGLGTGPGAGA